MRPIWNGMLSFGLVNIPIGLYPATDDHDLHLHLLHEKDHGRVKNQRVCSVDGQPLDPSEIVKAYEYEKGKYVELTDEDLNKVKIEASDRIVIDDFVDASEISPTFFEKPYFLLPGKKSDAPYALLREALAKSGKVGIARIVIRTRERLAAVRVDGNLLMLDTMHFADELREVEAPASSQAVGKREMDMATMLIDAMTTKFDASKYHDTYRNAVMEMIDEKVQGREVVHEEAHAQPTDILDLMSFLKKSIEQTEKGAAPTSQAEKPPKAAPARKRASAKAEPEPEEPAEKPAPKTRRKAAA
jgi:DNA end-binding protein Ku